MQCTNPLTIYPKIGNKIGKIDAEMTDGMQVPCGKCTACRIQKRKEWSMRLLHETLSWQDFMFITLTYDEQHVPYNIMLSNACSFFPTLRKSDLQKFFKRVRKQIAPFKIKYFACGEYGEENLRPHYHIILFGLGLADKQIIKDCWPYCDWDHPKIEKNSFGNVEIKSIEYVAGYIDKKLSGELSDEEYGHQNKEPVFKLNSQGMGLQFCIDNKIQLQQDCSVNVFGQTHALPRYYIDKANIDVTKAKKRAETLEKFENEKFGGIRLTEAQIYKNNEIKILNKINNKKKLSRSQKDANLNAKISLKKLRKI